MTKTFTLSSFELLFEPITPKTGVPINPSPNIPDPIVVQAYFVLISNVGSVAAPLSLTFNSTPNATLSFKDLFYVFDVNNSNFTPNNLSNTSENKAVVKLPSLTPGQTALFLLQPNIVNLLNSLGNPPDISKAAAALRGYVEVSSSIVGSKFLISPAIRGTFFNQSATGGGLQVVSEEAYSLSNTDGNIYDFSDTQVQVIAGRINAQGGIISKSTDFSIIKIDTGVYSLSFTSPTGNFIAVTASQIYSDIGIGGGDTLDNVVITQTQVQNGFVTITFKTGDSNGNAQNRQFSFIVVI